jgi:hypothetical protein
MSLDQELFSQVGHDRLHNGLTSWSHNDYNPARSGVKGRHGADTFVGFKDEFDHVYLSPIHTVVLSRGLHAITHIALTLEAIFSWLADRLHFILSRCSL